MAKRVEIYTEVKAQWPVPVYDYYKSTAYDKETHNKAHGYGNSKDEAEQDALDNLRDKNLSR